jgi:hypothetical protein
MSSASRGVLKLDSGLRRNDEQKITRCLGKLSF